MKYIGDTKLDERIIRTDLDPGFTEGRQYGRGKSDGRVCDEHQSGQRPVGLNMAHAVTALENGGTQGRRLLFSRKAIGFSGRHT